MTTEPQEEYDKHTFCERCGYDFVLVRKNVIRCNCSTRFLDLAKLTKEYEDKLVSNNTIH